MNDKQSNNQVLSPHRRAQRLGLVRSLSASSSSSFDSCSDLLGSLENTEENSEDLLNLQHTDCKDSDSGANDDVNCHQIPSHSESVLALKQCECVTNKEVLHSEVKDEGAPKVELTSVKDHVYSLSNAISFNTVRFLAENTVERISQLQTSFRLPASYYFPLKGVLQTDSEPSPAESDVQTGATTEIDHSARSEPTVGEVANDAANAERNFSVETSTLLPKEYRDAVHMPLEGVDDNNGKLDEVHTKILSIQDKLGLMEGIINEADKESQSEDEFAGDSLDAISITDARTFKKDDVEINDAFVGNIVPLVIQNVSREDEFSNTVLNDCRGTNAAATANASSWDVEKSQNLQHLMTTSHTSVLSDPDEAVVSEGLRFLTKQSSDEDSGSQHFEMFMLSSLSHKKNSTFCHPLRSLSSGSGRPDLEEVDDEQNIPGGVLQIGLSNIESNDGVNNEETKCKGIDGDLDANISRVNQFGEQAVSLQNVGSSAWSGSKQERELIWCDDQPTQALDRVNSEYLSSEEQSFGEILNEEKWKGLSIRLQSELQSDQREQKDNLGPDELCRYVENLELNESYVDTVLDMEDVLLNCDENGSRERYFLASSSSVIGTPRSSRDGSLSSSTSGLHLFTSGESAPFTVDWVEVVGAKQKRGGSSFGERIVGVKDHTVYCIKVCSGNQEWEVFRRYRDFVDLYHQLRRKFNVRTEKSLPSPWKEVDRDSRKVFGSTHPNVVEVRSSRIEECLQSLLQAGPPFSTSSSLCWFLCPQTSTKGVSYRESHPLTSAAALQKELDVQLGPLESPYLQSPRSEVGSHKDELDHDRSSTSLGKTVKLNLRTHPSKNIKQLLSSQHHSCAGCYKHLEAERGLVHGFVQTLGWGKPRLCEYSGQLYCTSCHLNETAVLPAQVLWHWDFTPRRVSQLAKAYLDSIYDQPMLCVSAVNPYLYSRVPILSHVKDTRRKLSKMLACMLCPFRTRIVQNMGSRRYLLENNDFFALRDLEDLSKGAFAVLPSLLKAVLENLRVHITKHCSICSEIGEWCGAGVLCEEPFSPIFPFEEGNITSCKVCHVPFHKACFSRFSSCPACSDEQSKKLGAFKHSQVEELGENSRDVALLLGGEDASASPSLAGGADLQGGFELDKLSHTRKNWPSFYNLLPKKRLW